MQIFFCTFSLNDVLSQPAGVVLKATQLFLWIVAAAFRLRTVPQVLILKGPGLSDPDCQLKALLGH